MFRASKTGEKWRIVEAYTPGREGEWTKKCDEMLKLNESTRLLQQEMCDNSIRCAEENALTRVDHGL